MGMWMGGETDGWVRGCITQQVLENNLRCVFYELGKMPPSWPGPKKDVRDRETTAMLRIWEEAARFAAAIVLDLGSIWGLCSHQLSTLEKRLPFCTQPLLQPRQNRFPWL